MSNERLVLYSVFGLGYGIYLFFTSFSLFRQKRLIENTPTSKIRSIAMGRVEIYGTVIPNANDIIKAPFSDDDCVYCKWTIEEYRSTGKSSHWATVASDEVGKYFFLQDDTGTVLVDSRGAKVDIPITHEYSSVTPTIKSFLEGQEISYKILLGLKKKMRFREYLLAQDNKVYIMGDAGDNPFVEEASSDKNEADIMIQKSKPKSFYYISDKPEKDVLNRFKWRVFGGLFGGAGLIVVCLAIIFARFGIL